MENRLVDGATALQVLDNNPVQQLRRDTRIPDPVRIHHHNRTSCADAEARRLATFHSRWPEEQSFALQQACELGIECASTTIG